MRSKEIDYSSVDLAVEEHKGHCKCGTDLVKEVWGDIQKAADHNNMRSQI